MSPPSLWLPPRRRLAGRGLVSAVLLCVLGVATASSTSAHPLKGVVAPPTWSSCPSPSVGAIYAAPGTAARTVALTFDDGPGPSTGQILSILNRVGVRATFFNIGVNETRWPQDLRAEASEGFLIGDHTWSHPVLTSLSSSQQLAQLSAVATEQRSLVGSSPCSFRPPYGDLDAVTSSVASSLSMSTWMWSVDTEDWKAEGAAGSYWVNRIVSLAESEGGAQSHPVVLMHNQSIPMPATIAALPTIIEYFQSRHYRFVDLLGRSGPPDACGDTTAHFPTAPRSLLRGGALHAGEVLSSPNGQYTLTQDANGVLALQSAGRLLWSTPTRGHRGASTAVSPSGRLVVESPNGVVLWRSASGRPGSRLALADDGSLTLSTRTSTWWSVRAPATVLTDGHVLAPDWMLATANDACRLVMEPSGHLRLVSAAEGTLWVSRSLDAAAANAVLETNGNLEVVSAKQQVLWASGSLGPGARLTLTAAGRAVVEGRTGQWLWSTP